MTLAVLHGEHPPPWGPSAASTFVSTVDYRALLRHGVPLSRVPPVARVLFTPPSFWVRFETPLKLAGVLLLAALCVLFTLAYLHRRERRLLRRQNEILEASVADRTRDIQVANDELRAANENLEASLRRIESMQEQLVADARDSVLGRIAVGLAHEVNNPLAVISSSASSLTELTQPGRRSLLEMLIRLPGDELAILRELLERCRIVAPELAVSQREERRAETLVRLAAAGARAPATLADSLEGVDVSAIPDRHLRMLIDPENADVVEALFRTTAMRYSASAALQASTRIATTLEAIRCYARDMPKLGGPSKSDLDAGLYKALSLFPKTEYPLVRVRLSFAPDMPPASVSEYVLVRLWTTLIENAFQAMNYRGDFAVETKRDGALAIVSVCD